MVQTGVVVAVSLCKSHSFSKRAALSIQLVKGLGVEGDAHFGATVKHRSRLARDPSLPNLRQVHLIHEELHEELQRQGFGVGPGDMGENITTSGLDLLGLPTGTRLAIGDGAVLEVTGLRNPCSQLDIFQKGLTAAVLDRGADGALIRKAGVMAVVIEGGEVRPGDAIVASLPAEPHKALECV